MINNQENYYFQRHKNPIVSLCSFHKNIIKMWRVKVNSTLILLLGTLVFLYGLMIYIGLEDKINRVANLIELLGIVGEIFMLVFAAPAVLFLLDLIIYIYYLKFSRIYKLSGLGISDQGINFKFKDKESFFDYDHISKLTYCATLHIIAGFSYLLSSNSSFKIFYNIEAKEIDGSIANIILPLDIEKMDMAIEAIASRLEKNKVAIGFSEGEPTTAYLPSVTHAGFANEPIGKWVLFFLVLLFLVVYIGAKIFIYK